jgi:uncharacterized protein
MTTATLSQAAKKVNWLLTSFVDTCPGVDLALAVSTDGLLIAISEMTDRGEADKLSAVITGLQALGEGGAQIARKGFLNRVLLDMETGYLIIAAIGDGAILGVQASDQADLGMLGYQMTLLGEKFGSNLTPDLLAHLKLTVQ